ncbi:YHS domain-containing (seleno)protein [Lyngbya aestuarii]|uniref:YHS domain-containing (seleno)protein n=1 Tax=Lyngbya aestuarii TaxID=118322 RepID=UPI00403E1A42
MKVNYFATLTTASLLSLALTAGCTQSSTQTTNPTTENTEQASSTIPNQENKTQASPTAASNESNTKANTTAANPEAGNQGVFYEEGGIAIRGTDPVAYFQQGKPVQGKPQYTYQWANITWQFSSTQNRDLFASNPEKYAPQYGGFCAWAVSQNYTAGTDPNAWTIVNDKLYLNATKGVQSTWEKDIPGNIARANQNWPGILNNLKR